MRLNLQTLGNAFRNAIEDVVSSKFKNRFNSRTATTRYEDRNVRKMPHSTFYQGFSGLNVPIAYQWPNLNENILEDPPAPKPSTTVQSAASEHFPLFEKYLDDLLIDHHTGIERTARYVDTHAKRFSNNSKPDNSHFPKLVSTNSLCVMRFIGELKRRRLEASFSPAEKEHIIGFLLQWLDILTPLRRFIIGYLTDLHFIQFFRVTSDLIMESSVMTLQDEGQMVLAGLYCGSDSSWGYPAEVRLCEVRLGEFASYDEFLGQGSAGIVFADKSQNIAVKIFPDTTSADKELQNYNKVYNAVKDGCANFPTGKFNFTLTLIPDPAEVYVSYDHYCLITPLGFPKITFVKHSFAALVAFLYMLHVGGLVHRDIRPSNLIMFVKENAPTIRIIDYGTVCSKDTSINYEGTVYYASDTVLRALSSEMNPKVAAQDDLHSLIRTARSLVACSGSLFDLELHKFDDTNYNGIISFWDKALTGIWEVAIKAANELDYYTLYEFFTHTLNVD